MKIKLAPDLEKALLRSIMEGVCRPDVVSPEELSKPAQQVHASIERLLQGKASVPLKPAAVILTAQNLFGADPEEFKDYLMDE